jgi:predicted GNAT family acetyltransferase
MADVEPTVTDAAAEERYEAREGGALVGVLEYRLMHDRIALLHTEVDTAFEGRGIAGRLAAFALGDARRRGLGVVPVCPYVRRYLERHPEEQDLVRGSAARG